MGAKDYTGMVFGKLTAIKNAGRQRANGAWIWEYRCECGGTTETTATDIRSGHTKSCGCLHREVMKKVKTTHGMEGTRLYRTWSGMKTRCNYRCDAKDYHIYGGRGIKVCDEWIKFEKFGEWALSNGYTDELQIDRKDNEKGYNPANCRWVTPREQQSNRCNTRVVKLGTEHFTIREVSEMTGLSLSMLSSRWQRGAQLFSSEEIEKLVADSE